ncbi:MAG TPA: phenylpyruvate tautomerase MIF-related protein [Polyangia bacterium]|jgi:phenylpyruvate tautomerase PptA (4-oxalocrotonate tautomerase family)|nr:phenylpyruvate tautomerase MIF-related protein [Polyangia bacterium]
MPLINVFTSADLPSAEKVDALLRDLSALLAKRFSKPERYVMTSLVPRPRLTFAGTASPACFVEIKNVGEIAPALARSLSADVSSRLQQALGVPPDRIYLEMAHVEGHLWGWNGDTFG